MAERYRAILAYFGAFLALIGLLVLSPLSGLAFWPQEARLASGFLAPGLACGLAGAALWRVFRPTEHPALSLQEGGIIVTWGWIAASLASAWPLMTILGLTFPQAVFEAVSGLTTTGLSVVDVTTAPRTVLLWRSIMQLAGGAGLAIIMLAAIAGPAGTGISGAEGRMDRLAPHVRKSAALVVSMYTGYAVAGTVGLRLAGMNWFDALNHSFAAISTGGFSTRVASIGHWESPAIEAVTIVLMILGNINFLTASLLFSGRFRDFARTSELRFFAVLCLAAVACLFAFTASELDFGPGKRLRVALFEAVTALTTTGFSTVGYSMWNAMGIHVLVLLMLVGGGTGSTAGGLKQYRVDVLLRSIWWELRRSLLPPQTVHAPSVWFGGRREYVGEGQIARIAAYVAIYLLFWALGVAVLALSGYALRDCIFEFTSAIGTVGLSIGVTSAETPTPALWAMTGGMLLGRLEFFVIFTSLAKLVLDALHGLARRRN